MENIKEYFKVDDIEFFLTNTPQITFEVTDACNLKFTYSMTTNALFLHWYIDYLVKRLFHLLFSPDGNRENTSVLIII